MLVNPKAVSCTRAVNSAHGGLGAWLSPHSEASAVDGRGGVPGGLMSRRSDRVTEVQFSCTGQLRGQRCRNPELMPTPSSSKRFSRLQSAMADESTMAADRRQAGTGVWPGPLLFTPPRPPMGRLTRRTTSPGWARTWSARPLAGAVALDGQQLRVQDFRGCAVLPLGASNPSDREIVEFYFFWRPSAESRAAQGAATSRLPAAHGSCLLCEYRSARGGGGGERIVLRNDHFRAGAALGGSGRFRGNGDLRSASRRPRRLSRGTRDHGARRTALQPGAIRVTTSSTPFSLLHGHASAGRPVRQAPGVALHAQF